MSCYIDVVGCTNNDDHNGIDKGDCPYCEIDRLTAQLAEANERCRLLDEKAGDWQHRYTQETMRLQSQLAERDGAITCYNEVLAELREEVEKLRHQSINWVPVFDANMELQVENLALREEVGRLKEIGNRRLMHCNQCGSDLIVDICSAGKSIHTTDIRKHMARDCVDLCCKTMNKIITSNVGCGDYKNNCAHFNELEFRRQAKKKFGLEG